MSDHNDVAFDPACKLCPRLVAERAQVASANPTYHAAPVPAFGDPAARLLIVGLAPGKHGANATGRPFTGDHAGILLYRALFDLGFANLPESQAPGDGLVLTDCRVTNAVKCLPPGNKPTGLEVRTCNRFLATEWAKAPPEVIVALGRVAHDAVLRACRVRLSAQPFGHGHKHRLPGPVTLIDSYHCSRYNTQTGRLTPTMFYAVLESARAELDGPSQR